MAARTASSYAHGPSEVWQRPAVKRAIERSRRRLGVRLRAIREERELTQEAAAERAGIHAKHLSVIEIGKTNISFGSLVALAYAYQVSLEALFKGAPVPR